MAYTTVAEVRALEGLSDTTVYPDAALQTGIDVATALIDGYCGTSFEAKSFSVTLDGNGNYVLPSGVLFIRSITSVTVDGVAQSTANYYGRDEGLIVRVDGGSFPYSYWGANVVVAGTAGVTATASEEIKWAARTLARQYALDLHARIPSRAITVQSESGQFEVRAQAGGAGRPTSLPDVNAVLNRNKHKAGMMGSVIS